MNKDVFCGKVLRGVDLGEYSKMYSWPNEAELMH